MRIRPAGPEGPPVAERIDDPWRVFECDDAGDGCSAEFQHPEFAVSGGEVVYYARALQVPTLAINAGGFRCTYDEAGNCVEVAPCSGDDRTSAHDDCLAENREHAWSSPIFAQPCPPAAALFRRFSLRIGPRAVRIRPSAVRGRVSAGNLAPDPLDA